MSTVNIDYNYVRNRAKANNDSYYGKSSSGGSSSGGSSSGGSSGGGSSSLDAYKKLYGLKVAAEQGGVTDSIKQQASALRGQLGDASLGSNMNAQQFYNAYINHTGGGGGIATPSTGYSAPTFNGQRDSVNYSDMLRQAQQQFDPLRKQTITDIQNKTAQDRYAAGNMAANQGVSHSGLAADLQNKLTIGQNSDIARANSQYDSQIAQLAQNLYQYQQSRSDQNYRDAYQQFLNDRNFGYQQFADNRNYDTQQQRFQVGDNQWNQSFGLQQQQFQQQQKQQEISNAWNEANALGAVTPKLSALTGIPVGTPTLEAKQMQNSYNLQQQQIGISQQNADTAASKASAPDGVSTKKTADQTLGDFTTYFTKMAEDYKNGASKLSLQDWEKKINAEAKTFTDQGYPLQSVIDSLYRAFSNGQFPTKKAYDDYAKKIKQQQDQYYKDQNKSTNTTSNIVKQALQ